MSTILPRASSVAAVVILAWLVARMLLVTIASSTTSVSDRMATADHDLQQREARPGARTMRAAAVIA